MKYPSMTHIRHHSSLIVHFLPRSTHYKNRIISGGNAIKDSDLDLDLALGLSINIIYSVFRLQLTRQGTGQQTLEDGSLCTGDATLGLLVVNILQSHQTTSCPAAAIQWYKPHGSGDKNSNEPEVRLIQRTQQ